MRTKTLLGSVLLFVMAGCGGGGGRSGPRTYTLENATQLSVNAGQCSPVSGPVFVPAGASMTYTFTDTPVGIGSDDPEFGIIDDAFGCDFTAALHYEASLPTNPFTSTGPVDVNGNWDFVVACHNFADPCVFNLVWTATY